MSKTNFDFTFNFVIMLFYKYKKRKILKSNLAIILNNKNKTYIKDIKDFKLYKLLKKWHFYPRGGETAGHMQPTALFYVVCGSL